MNADELPPHRIVTDATMDSLNERIDALKGALLRIYNQTPRGTLASEIAQEALGIR